MKLTSLSLPALFAARGNLLRQLWDALHRIPGGKRLFSELVGRTAPYSGTIRAQVEHLERGRAEVSMRDRPGVRNHLDCVHAIALVNLAEITGNTALAYGLPDDARFIVSGIRIEYLKKARGTIHGICDCPVPTTNARQEFEVPVSLRDASGTEVARATLLSLVGPKK